MKLPVVIHLFGSILIVLGFPATTPRIISPRECPNICWDDLNFICKPWCFSKTAQWAQNPKKV